MGEHERKPENYYIDLSQHCDNDPEMNHWVMEFLQTLMGIQELMYEPSPNLEAQLTGEDIPDVLKMILSARA